MSYVYRPQRAAKSWLVDAPEYVRSCFDNNGRTTDRYTVTFCGRRFWEPSMGKKVACLMMSDNPATGTSMWGEVAARWCPHHEKVRWLDLPEHVRKHVIARAGWTPNGEESNEEAIGNKVKP